MREYLMFILVVSSAVLLNANPVGYSTIAQAGASPGLRSAMGMAYDPYNNVTVLYGGTSIGGGMNAVQDTWFYDYETNAWTQHTGISPPARTNTAMVYCSETNEIILYGGDGVTDTWSFDCETQTWSEVITSVDPGVHHSLALAYDPHENVVILFGGFDDEGWTTDETWSFDCDSREWTELFPSVKPLSRYGHVMTYDTNISKIILTCGNTRDQGHMDDTWTYEVATNTWTELDPIGDPTNLKWPSMVYDSINQKSILFGGQIGDSAVDETQIYDAHTNRWTNPHPDESPPPRINSGLAFDSEHGLVVLYGGLLIDEEEDLWVQMEDLWVYSYTENLWTDMSDSTPSGTDTEDTLPIEMILALIAIPAILVGAVVIVYYVRFRKD